jgi:TonB family protein
MPLVRPGNGIVVPRVLHEERPQYTAAAMREKIEGTVLAEGVVGTDGAVTDARIVRSLDSKFGLDEQAIVAARKWRFAPVTKNGESENMVVTIELTFELRK